MPQFVRNESPQGHDDEQFWVTQVNADESSVENPEENQDRTQIMENGDSQDSKDEQPWVTQAVEKFIEDLDQENYQQAWEALASSKRSEFSPISIQGKWEEYTRNKGGIKQKIDSKLEVENENLSIVCIKLEFENLEATEEIVVTFIKEDNERHRIFEFNPIIGEL